MPRPTTQRSAYAMTGSEEGSVFRTLSPAKQKEFRAWLQAKSTDSRYFEAQLSDRRYRRSRPAEV